MTESQNRKGSLAAEADEKQRPALPPTTEDVLREKSKSKLVKVLSVSVYIGAVTGNGFLLSVFYLFLWDPQIHATRPADMAPDYGWLGGPSRLTGDPSRLTGGPSQLTGDPSRLTGDPSRLTAPEIIFTQAHKDPKPPTVPYHRIMSTEFTNNIVNGYVTKNVPGSGVVGGIDQAEARVATGLPSSAQEDYENNASRPEHHVATAAAAAATTGIQSKANVSNSGSSEDDSNSSSSFGGAMGKRKKPSEEVSSPHQRPQVLQT